MHVAIRAPIHFRLVVGHRKKVHSHSKRIHLMARRNITISRITDTTIIVASAAIGRIETMTITRRTFL